jgi:glycosyltransferase 2 family protein
VAADIRGALLAQHARLGIAFASALVVAGHAITFMIAARTAGTTAPLSQILPIALLAMVAMTNVSGWGPREGVTAWAFAAAGLGAGRRGTTSVVYGVMVIVASLPGAAVLLVAWFRSTRLPARKRSPLGEGAAHA